MRHTTKRNLFLIGLALTSVLVSAQPSNVETVKMDWESSLHEDRTPEALHLRIEESVANIEQAKAHVKTANDYKMWYYRGYTFLRLANDGSEAQKAKYPNALDIATESFFNSLDTDIKGRLTEFSKQQLVNCAVGHYNKGVSAFNNKNYADALAAYENVLKIYPYDKEEFLTKKAQINKETIILYSAYSASGAGNKAKAKELLQQLIDNAYADPRIYLEMAEILLTEKDTNTALSYLALGREMFENDANLVRAELDLYLKLGRSQDLVSKLDAAIALEPESSILHFAKAINHYNLGNEAEAEKSYLAVIELDPTYYDAYYNLGVIYLDRCKPIADKIEKMSYEEGLKYETEIDLLYAKAATKFRYVLDNAEYAMDQKLELATNLKKLYGRLKQNDKTGTYQPLYNEMKLMINAAD